MLFPLFKVFLLLKNIILLNYLSILIFTFLPALQRRDFSLDEMSFRCQPDDRLVF